MSASPAGLVIAVDGPAASGKGTLAGPEIAFTRQSFVGLSTPWGQVDAGRMYTPMFYTLFKADPYGVNSVF